MPPVLVRVIRYHIVWYVCSLCLIDYFSLPGFYDFTLWRFFVHLRMAKCFNPSCMLLEARFSFLTGQLSFILFATPTTCRWQVGTRKMEEANRYVWSPSSASSPLLPSKMRFYVGLGNFNMLRGIVSIIWARDISNRIPDGVHHARLSSATPLIRG